MVEELHRAEPDVQALGFGIPSRIDQRAGRALKSVNIPLEGVDLRDRMRERHGLPVALDNDGNAAAIAEWRAGAARGARHVVMLTLGTGVGGGLILDGAPVPRRDRQRSRARPHRDRARRPALRLRGPRAPRVLRRRPGRGPCRAVAVRGRRRTRTSSSAAGRAGEAEAVEALAGIGRYLGAGIASFVNVFEPEVVVVGGGFGAAGELLLGAGARGGRDRRARAGSRHGADRRGTARHRRRRDRRRDGRVRGARQGGLVPLAVCATPIGNLEDVTLRVLRRARRGGRGARRGHAPHARPAGAA